jgi:hypothetical protein
MCCANFNKIEFRHALKGMRERAFRNISIASDFRKTGIFPYNPDVVLKQLADYDAKTPEPKAPRITLSTSSNVPTTPTSAQALKRYIDKVKRTELDPSVQTLLAPLLKGAVAMATSETLT